MEELAFRQVHLDFHTSGEIPGVGDEFDPDEFVAVLREAHVNSITCFAKDHHGYSFYPTQVGVQHPSLARDLLGEQVEAGHRAGIRVPAYISVVWDEYIASRHQEWRQVGRDGRLIGRGPLENRGWRWLCMNSAYVDYVAAQTEEVLRRYPVDGIFFDIVKQGAPFCVCSACVERLAKRGADVSDDAALAAQSLEISRAFMQRMTALVHSVRRGAGVFYNSRLRVDADPQRGSRPELSLYTHVEIESLPSGGWGYNHYPLFARYFQPFGKDMLGMTARFHKSWADFGSLKNQAALEYECFSMLATGAKCSIGDQLHPSGRFERAAYERIGAVYRSVEAKEPWCRGAAAVAEIGVLLAEGQPDISAEDGRHSDEGALRMLLECGRTFQFLDLESDLEDYHLILLPDSVRIGTALAVRLREYLAQGGRLICSGESGLDPSGTSFALRELGLRSAGPSKWDTAYMRVDERSPLARGVEPMDHVMYERGWTVLAEPDTQVLAYLVPPYFNRDHAHFSSHAQTPPALAPDQPLPSDATPAITRREGAIYIAFPLCRAYRRHGNRVYRTMLSNAIDLLLPDRLITTGLPCHGQATVMRQASADGRVIAHLLSYAAERRTPQIDVIEDADALHEVAVEVRLDFEPRRVYEAPSQRDLPFSWQRGVAGVVLPEVRGHAMVVFEP